METLDLHGERHEQVVQKVHSFVYNNDLPVRVITGKSQTMKKIVVDTVSQLGYYTHCERLINEGCLIVTEQEFVI
jgi:precorrin-4 methylase